MRHAWGRLGAAALSGDMLRKSAFAPGQLNN